MRKICWLGLSLLFQVLHLNAQVTFFEIQNLSNEFGPAREHNVVNNGDQYFLVWNQWGDIKFRKSDNGGLNWGNKITLYSAFDYGGSYPVVAASQGKVYVAYFRNTPGNSQIFMVKSTNNGQSFSNEVQVTTAINLAQVPQIAASGDTVVIAYEDRDANWNYQIYLIKSIDGGQTWSAPHNISNTTNHARWCNLVMRGNELYVLWNDQTGLTFNDLDVFFTKSQNFGQSWTTPVNITNNGAYNARLSTTVKDNSVYVVVSAKVDGLQSDIMLYRSGNLGTSWNAPVNLSDNTGNSSRPDIWVTPNFDNNHRIYVVWTDETYHANERAYLRYSLDNGFTWSAMMEFSQNTEDAAWAQIIGQAVGPTDKLYLSWYRPHEGTFDFEVWGRRAENQLALDVNLSGTITGEDSQPVANATVALDGYVVFSQPNGHYSLDVPAGVYDFTVSAAGYQNFSIPQLEIVEDMVIDVSLEVLVPGNYPPHLLQAQVVDVENIMLSWEVPIGFSSIELAHDDGEANGMFWIGSATGNEFMAVAFEHPESFYLRQLKLYTEPGYSGETLLLYVLADNGGLPDINNSLGGPFMVEINDGWTTVAVDIPIPQNIRFHIACQWNASNTYKVGGDMNQPAGFSYSTSNNGNLWHAHDDMNFMIRAGIAFDSKSGANQNIILSGLADPNGYHVYLNGDQQGGLIETTSFLLSEVTVGQTHTIGVTAVYDSGESPMAIVEVEVPEPLLFPPLNLTAEIAESNVILAWSEPASEGEWLHWDNGVNADAVGGSNILTFDAAIRFTPNDLAGHDGLYLTQISAFIADIEGIQMFVKVWQGGNQNYAGTLVRQQQLQSPQADSWNTIQLDNPLLIDASQELWIGYRIINPAGVYPAGTDSGPAVPFKGDMLLYGSNWVSMQNQFGWNINWNIKGFVVDAQTALSSETTSLPYEQLLNETGSPTLLGLTRNLVPFRWEYGHFNIYRNTEIIGTSDHAIYTFVDISPLPENNYFVTTAWGNFESAPSNEVYVNLVGINELPHFSNKLKLIPNPAQGHSTVNFKIEHEQAISLCLVNLQGKTIEVLSNTIFAKGEHSILLGREVLQQLGNSQIILVRLTTESEIHTSRLIRVD